MHMHHPEDAQAVRAIQPEGWPRPSGYANGILVPAGRDLLFVAGQIGWDENQRVVSDDFVAQFEQALINCLAVVRAAGGGPEDVVRLTIYVTDKSSYLDRLRDVGQAWKAVMGRHYPAMALVVVAGLVEEGARVEIEATAALAARDTGGSD
jgi:enamine deaminase RidA (YjgF/YER057c/UK114 family)